MKIDPENLEPYGPQNHPLPDMMTLDPDDAATASEVWIHDQLDRADRLNERGRDHDASIDVREARAQEYLFRKHLEEVRAQGSRFERSLPLVALLILAVFHVIWAAALARVVF